MLFWLSLAGLFGLIVGSFLTALVPRLKSGETALRGRSRCVGCQRQLRWFELLPVLSFLLQGGQCRSCGAPIPRSYPVIELATALLFVAIAWGVLGGSLPMPLLFQQVSSAGDGAQPLGWLVALFLYYAFLATVAVAVSAYDVAYRLIPRMLILPLAVVGLGVQLAGAVRSGDLWAVVTPLGVGVATFLFFWSLWFFSQGRAMGRGDANVAFALAVALGSRVFLLGLLFAFWGGAAVGIFLVGLRKLGWRSQIPFAPFLFAGGIAALFALGYFPLVQLFLP